jgi:hypothetical protein
MSTIWKFSLQITDHQYVEMPSGARILCVQTQRDFPCLWVLVDPDAPRGRRGIGISGTGHPCLHDSDGYIGTVQLDAGALVFHVFDLGEAQ